MWGHITVLYFVVLLTMYRKEYLERQETREGGSDDREQWKGELLGHRELFEKLYDRLPQEFMWMRELILSAHWRSDEHWRLEPETA